MTTKFNVGDTVLIEGIVETIYVGTTDNEPIYNVRIKGAGTYEAYDIRVKEDVMKDDTKNVNDEERPKGEDCEGCKHDNKAPTEYPCAVCKHNHLNMFEWKETN